MQLPDLLKWIEEGENVTVEFKTSYNNEVIVSLVAFANTEGGAVLIGLKDNREIVCLPIQL